MQLSVTPGRLVVLRSVLADTGRVLTFRQPSGMFLDHWRAYLICGLGMTLLAGMGRYWNNPRAELWQQLGMGSVVYVIVLALVLRVLLVPFKPRACTLRNLLLFLLITSPPGLLFLIPVESFFSLRGAQLANAGLLGFVALWRVTLLMWFLRSIARLSGLAIVIASLAPLIFIAATLTLLNLEHVVIDYLNGVRPEQYSPNDLSYSILTLLSFISMFAAPYLLVGYAWAWYRADRMMIVQPTRRQP
ncbi:hypothetical protein [Pseudomonas saliphila]|uniref:hypothetical protein n=1 Tax=Pseudomonas saliphila TaxID=2586906 RepID=UPI001238D4A6|nr:hypothetical protein [Pseudomonas saliphila]